MFSNRYIFTYATVMIIIVATILASAANILKPYQQKNVEMEKIRNILSVADVLDENVKYNFEQLKTLYGQTITGTKVINTEAKEIEGVDAFTVDLAVELRKPKEQQYLPVFIAQKGDEYQYIIPVRGKGLWGPIWGFLSLKKDGTITGANFGHKGETPGLGAEIDKEKFGNQFVGKQIFDKKNEFKSVSVIKGGAIPDDLHGVDAISGGTITSNGVSEMLYDCLKSYEKFFKNFNN